MQSSPITGWTRDHWAQLADHLLSAAMRHATPPGSGIRFPGKPSGLGPGVGELEGFARTALLAAFRLMGSSTDPLGLVEFYGRGILTGTDPDDSGRWVTADEQRQAVVEAASLVVFLDATRTQFWDAISDADRQRIIAWLARARHQVIPDNNWAWFIVLVETFLRSAGAPWDAALINRHLDRIDQFHVADGWYCDGDMRAFDHYNGWAFNTLPQLWLGMTGARELAGERADIFGDRLAAFLRDAVHLVGADGAPLMQGRSLIYRTAVAAPFWAAAYGGVDALPLGQLRRAASGIVRYFADHGAPTSDGVYTVGWFDQWPAMTQFYSSSGSPYWAAKGFLGLALPATHPVWTAVEEPLPVERGDFVRAMPAPGWLVSGTKADGVIRVYNHGTDHGQVGAYTAEPPLYAKLAYSTATFPLVDDADDHPIDNTVAVVHPTLGPSHRSGMQLLTLRAEDGLGVARSRWRAHWIIERSAEHHLGAHLGTVALGPWLTVTSVVSGADEVRIIEVTPDDETTHTGPLLVTGWPAAGVEATVDGVIGLPQRGTTEHRGLSPLAEHLTVAWASGPDKPAATALAHVRLRGSVPTSPDYMVKSTSAS